jgi:predicted transcriptional regulator
VKPLRFTGKLQRLALENPNALGVLERVVDNLLKEKQSGRLHLRAARLRADFTQEQLAAASGVSQEIISRLENGLIRNPSFETVTKLADALQCDPRQLRFAAEAVATS